MGLLSERLGSGLLSETPSGQVGTWISVGVSYRKGLTIVGVKIGTGGHLSRYWVWWTSGTLSGLTETWSEIEVDGCPRRGRSGWVSVLLE